MLYRYDYLVVLEFLLYATNDRRCRVIYCLNAVGTEDIETRISSWFVMADSGGEVTHKVIDSTRFVTGWKARRFCSLWSSWQQVRFIRRGWKLDLGCRER